MSSILETFVLLFESNADDVKKGADDATRSADKLETSLKSNRAASDAVGASLVEMATRAGGAIAALLSLGAITDAVFRAADFADQVGEFSQKLGLNVEDVSAWGDALQVNGGSAEGFRSTVESLSMAFTEFAVKGKSRVSPYFDELGIKMTDAAGKARNVMDVLPELATAFEGLSRQESAALGQKLGLDQGTIMLLQRGRREVEEQVRIQKELGVVTAKQAEIAGDFNDQWDNTAKVFRSLFGIVSASVLPVFTKVLAAVQNAGSFIQKHSDFIVGLMIALGTAIAVYVLPPLVSMAAAAVVAFAPFLLIGVAVAAAAAAFALLYDDVMNFIDGNDSLIGQLMTEYPIIGSIVEGLGDILRGVWDVVQWGFNTMLSLLQLSVEGWKLLGAAVGGWFSDFASGSSLVQDVLTAWGDMFKIFGNIAGGVWDRIAAKVRAFIDLAAQGVALVKNVAGAITGGLESAKAAVGLSPAQAAIGAATTSPINAMTSNVTSNSTRAVSRSTSVQTGPITVQTQATDGKSVADELGRTLGSQIQQATSGFDDGVAA